MFSSHFTKIFASLALAAILFSGCGFWRKSEQPGGATTVDVADEFKSEIPFEAREPARFQAEIIVSAGGAERKTFIARRDARRRSDFDFGTKNQLTALETDKSYLILPAKKIYAENASGAVPTGAADEWQEFLTTEWLSEKPEAKFEKLETIDGATKYRVVAGTDAEVLVFFDEKIGLPVRQEFYTLAGGQKTLTFAFELKNVKLDAGDDLFAIPADFRKVSVEELRKQARGEDNKE